MKWGSMSDPGYNPMNYSRLLSSLSSMASDEMEPSFITRSGHTKSIL